MVWSSPYLQIATIRSFGAQSSLTGFATGVIFATIAIECLGLPPMVAFTFPTNRFATDLPIIGMNILRFSIAWLLLPIGFSSRSVRSLAYALIIPQISENASKMGKYRVFFKVLRIRKMTVGENIDVRMNNFNFFNPKNEYF